MIVSEQPTPRPRAQYGEYASPEEQLKAKGQAADVSLDASTEPVAPVADRTPAGGTAPRRAHPVDRIVTIALLGFGLFTVITSIPGYLRMPEAMQTVYDQFGAGTYSDGELADALGIVAIVSQAAIWILTAAFTVWSLKRDRFSWWIPVVGGAVAFASLMIIVSIALMADPSFVSSIS